MLLFRKRRQQDKKAKEEEEPDYPGAELVRRDMEARADIIKFDLSEQKWFDDPELFWSQFKHTGEILVPEDIEKWLIGQERMKEEFFQQLEEWVRKAAVIQKMRREGTGSDIDEMRKFLKEWPGPYLLFPGEPGTGKSLLIKIANSKLKELYKKHGIQLQDVLLIKNPRNHMQPIPKYVPAGMGLKIKEYQEHAQTVKSFKQTVLRSFLGFMILTGVLLIMTAIFLMIYIGATQDPDVAWFTGSGIWLQFLVYGMFLIVFPLLLVGFFNMASSGSFGRGSKRNENDSVPAVIVDNSGSPDLYVDMTQANAANLFGAIQHDPYQSGGLGTPTHHRVQAGSIHQADFKIAFFDEFKNFLFNEQLVIEFLTPLENGSYPIRGRGWLGSEGNASLAGETKTPVDSSFFLIAACNFDALPLLNKYPALRSRFSYGNIVRAEDEIDATPQNAIKIAQFLADESYRFHTPPVCNAAVRLVIAHARRKGSTHKKMRLKMRPYIQILKKSAQIVWSGGAGGQTRTAYETCSCRLGEKEMIHAEDMRQAIEVYAKPIEQQILDANVERRKPYRLIFSRGSEIGMVNGMVIVTMTDSEEMTGDVANVSVWMTPLSEEQKKGRSARENFKVTGAPTKDEDTWIQNSVQQVKTAILRLYGIDLESEYYVHVSFVQSNPKGMDGPSAGITMTLAIMSVLGDPRLPLEQRKPIPMRQDTAVTGTIENIGMGAGDVKVGPIGGVPEKIYGAEKAGLKRVILPSENYHNTYFELDMFKRLTIKSAASVLEYLDLVRADKEAKDDA